MISRLATTFSEGIGGYAVGRVVLIPEPRLSQAGAIIEAFNPRPRPIAGDVRIRVEQDLDESWWVMGIEP